MIPLNLPPSDIKLKKNEEGEVFVFDILRRKWIKLTPEEYPRGLFLYLDQFVVLCTQAKLFGMV